MEAALLRYGEVALKSSGVRKTWERLHKKAIASALHKIPHTIENSGGRFIVRAEKIPPEILRRIPGIQSFSISTEFEFTNKKQLLQKAAEIADVQNKTFCVRAKRTGQHAFTSTQLERELGEMLLPKSKGVKLKNPDTTIHLEIRGMKAFLFTKKTPGLGGIPATSGGKALCLLSGGIDSPVAAVQMLKKGCHLDFAYVNLIGEKALNDVAKIYNYLADKYCHGYTPKLHAVDGKKLLQQIHQVEDTFRQLAFKIAIYKIGESLGYKAIVTGESLSQKSSQTLQSLHYIQKHSNILVLRPLLASDKHEIFKMAEKIGTRAASEKIPEYCNLSEGKVTARPKDEHKFKIPDTHDLPIKTYKGQAPITEDTPQQTANHIITVDVRPAHKQKAEPIPTDKQVPYEEAHEHSWEDSNYLLVCDYGVMSENLAFTLRKKGINAAGTSLPAYLTYRNRTSSQ